MEMQYPPALVRAFEQVDPDTHNPGKHWKKYSEEWYWDMLLKTKPFRSIYADEPGSKQPLISSIKENLSQTPREQCELEGIVKEGRELSGPRQEVELHGLQARPELNGQTGRVLPTTGNGAPSTTSNPGRVAVRLAGSLQEVAVRPVNLRSPHSATAASSTVPGEPSTRRARLAQLLREEFKLWHTSPTVNVADLRKAGMPASHIKCCSCERSGQQVDRYVGLKRTAPLSSKPLPFSAVRLQCVDCFTADADDARVKLEADAVEKYVDTHMMGGVQVCSILMGYPSMEWGGQSGSGALY